MKSLLVVTALVGMLQVTSYRSVSSQTDSSPYTTSIGERTSPHGVAVSRDLLCGACRKLKHQCKHPEYAPKIHYHDCLYIEDIGYRIVNDVMGDTAYDKQTRKRVLLRNRLDVWVPSHEAEIKFHKQFGHRKLNVWKITKEDLTCSNKSRNSKIRFIRTISTFLTEQSN